MRYKIELSDRPAKKYMAVFDNGKKIYFGSSQYAQYRDSTPLKAYSHLDHNDSNRREKYRKRHEKIQLKDGRYAYQVKYTPAWFSYKFLW